MLVPSREFCFLNGGPRIWTTEKTILNLVLVPCRGFCFLNLEQSQDAHKIVFETSARPLSGGCFLNAQFRELGLGVTWHKYSSPVGEFVF